MTGKQSFECTDCGNKIEQESGSSPIPECCGKPMKAEALDVCQASSTAEHSRFDELGEPCDDGRAGK